MKATGIVRHLDHLGRFVVPIEIRRSLNVGDRDPLEVFVDGDRIILQKFTPGCISCGLVGSLMSLPSGQPICQVCFKGIR